jgi:hypothetical protein
MLNYPLTFLLLTLLRLIESDAEPNALKAMVDNAIAFFYLDESSSEARPPDARQSAIKVSGDYSRQYETAASLPLGIFKSLYPWANLDTTGEGFMVTCTDEEALMLIED